jgi:hypothetical protein
MNLSVSDRKLLACQLSSEKLDGANKTPRSKSVDHTQSTVQAYVNFVRASVGPGMLALPFAFLHAGYVLGSCLLAVLTLVILYNMVQLVECRHFLNRHKTTRQYDWDFNRRRSRTRNWSMDDSEINLKSTSAPNSPANSPERKKNKTHNSGPLLKTHNANMTVSGASGEALRRELQAALGKDDRQRTNVDFFLDIMTHKSEILTYGDMGLAVFGKEGKIAMEAVLVVLELGICTVYFSFLVQHNLSYEFAHC